MIELTPEAGGYFAGSAPEAKAGDRYGFSLDGGPPLPDPASRFQPGGPHGLSEIVDPDGFEWRDAKWKGIHARDAVLYELHVGAFTAKGDWDAASERLPHLADLGVTIIELMPVAEFAGRFGWGYDGVDLFAPTHLYGPPDAMRRFVNSAHELGLAVILDVVYNHFGPDGCYIQEFSKSYFSDRHDTDWGRGINFDGKSSGPVREFYIANTVYWITEFHLDGLRFDATQSIFDESKEHILSALGRAARQAGGSRSIYLVAENERQETRIARPLNEGGNGLDALWNDDFHHTAAVALTGRSEAYYTDYKGSPQEFISAAKYGYLYQGQRYDWQKNRRGKPSFGLPHSSFVNYLENHDQTANSAKGLRMHQMANPGLHRALTAYLLLAPQPPMLFQGQEYSSSRPFLYFADQKGELAKLVRSGRKEFLAQFPRIKESSLQGQLADPGASDTFECCKLDWAEKESHSSAYALHKDLIALRRGDPVVNGRAREGVDGAVLSNDCLLLRYFAEDRLDRLLIVNLGRDLRLSPAPEPLLAPPDGRRWEPILSTEDSKYGGFGEIPLEGLFNWRIPAQAAVLMTSVPQRLEGE
jgi:maltooligosyltrehalose trehalohydrolase